MDRADYVKYDGLGLADLIRRKQVSAAEVEKAARAQIEATNPALNAVIEIFESPAEASQAPDAPFHGVPFLMKDIGAAMGGSRTGGACRYLSLAPAPAADDALTARFRAAGLRIMGKTNLPELGFNVTTEPAWLGPTRNPWDPAHSAGGSSGGSAAAVAAGMVPLAHATDGAGSIRIPAACCGLIGLKPSRGALPQGPSHADIYGGLVTDGVVSRSLRDTAAALDVMFGADPGAPYAAPPRAGGFRAAINAKPPRLRIGINHQCLPDVPVSPEALTALGKAVGVLETLGHRVMPVTLPIPTEDLQIARDVYLAQACANAAADAMVLAKLIGRAPKEGEMERVNLAAVERGRRMTAADFLTVTRSGHDFTRRLAAIWQQVDIILTPALAGPARELGAFPMDHDDVVLHVARMLRFAPFTATFNVTGDPALVAPVALSSERLPLGVQLVAPLGGDALVLQLGAQLMDALPFRPASEAIIAGL